VDAEWSDERHRYEALPHNCIERLIEELQKTKQLRSCTSEIIATIESAIATAEGRVLPEARQPDLLAALKSAREALEVWMKAAGSSPEREDWKGWQWVLDDADAAIAKAEGR
jgi:hypothetical protein